MAFISLPEMYYKDLFYTFINVDNIFIYTELMHVNFGFK